MEGALKLNAISSVHRRLCKWSTKTANNTSYKSDSMASTCRVSGRCHFYSLSSSSLWSLPRSRMACTTRAMAKTAHRPIKIHVIAAVSEVSGASDGGVMGWDSSTMMLTAEVSASSCPKASSYRTVRLAYQKTY